ncbi:MAG: hypothetical protein FJ096_11670 [Deltaproteobacteria bacterium]|nr:hypothetical protein [Deltaproteobacteria bacterium]
MSRRSLLVGVAGLVATRSVRAAEPAASAYEIRDIVVSGRRATGRRFTLLVPRHVEGPVPLLVALHGKGETIDEKLGVYAWLERYGLGTSYERLLRPPVAPVEARGSRTPHWKPERLREVNDALAARPFGGLAVACPFTPDAFNIGARKAFLDDYAAWLVDEVVPRARRELAILEGSAHVGVDGVSLGGYVSIEVFLRQAAHFGAWGTLQGAINKYAAPAYAKSLADVLARVGPRRLHIETSLGDVYLEDNEALSAKLRKLGVDHDFVAPPGAHNQPFLRDSGTLEMLLWHDRALRA